MADVKRPRLSSSESDSSCIDLDESPYATVASVDSDQNLLLERKGIRPTKGDSFHYHGRCLAVVALALSVVCILVTISGAYYVIIFVQPVDPLSRFEQVCMPCSHIRPNPLTNSEFAISQHLDVEVSDDETEICCARTPTQYTILFKLILQRQEEVKNFADKLGSRGHNDTNVSNETLSVSSTGGNIAISAHLLIKAVKTEEMPDTEDHGLQQWKSPEESPLSHVRPGLDFHKNKITVLSPGLYFVYCQILYNRASGQDNFTLVSNYVKRHSITYPASSGILLKARHTRVSGSDDRHSSYVGGLFYLHAGDVLFVQVALPELVSHDDKASFFGLFRVGE